MSYIVIPVYSFVCNHDERLDGRTCPAEFECTPANGVLPRLLDEAHRQLKAEGWTVRGSGENRSHFCRHHAAEGRRQ